MNPWLMLAVVAALAGAGGAGYWKGGNDAEAEHLRIEKAQEQAHKDALQAAAKEIAKIDVKSVTIQGKVIERIRTEQVYTECRHSPDAWKLVQEVYK